MKYTDLLCTYLEASGETWESFARRAGVSGDELPGRMTRMQNLFFRVNGLAWWTDSWRKAAGLMMSHDLALEKHLSWERLGKERKRALSLYGIDGDRWEIIRSGETRAADGKHYLTPDALDDVPAETFVSLLQRQGRAPTETSVRALRGEIQERLRTYFRDRVDYAVINPDAKTRSYWRRGTSAGTPEGELLRAVAQFKSFPTAYIQKAMGRETMGRGADSMERFLRNEGGSMQNLARLALMTTLFGYGSMVAKDMLKGRSPRDPADYKTWIAAAAQGGGLGIFGDFLFGEANRMGGGLVSTMAGPTLGTLEDMHNIYARIRDGDSAAQATLRFIINNTPGNNLWWARTAFDYIIGYQLFEWLNPGYFDRVRRRVERENNQTFWLRPASW